MPVQTIGENQHNCVASLQDASWVASFSFNIGKGLKMPFAKGAVLIKATAITEADLASMGSLKGDIAGKIGPMLVKEYKADKEALLFKDAEKLKSNKKVAGKKSLTYTVEVDSKAKSIEFCLHSSGKELARATLYDGLDKLDKGAVVVNMDKGDATIDSASSKQAGKFNGPGSEAKDEKVKLKGINNKKKIVLCGHGGGPDVSGDELYTASEFGGKSVDEIVKFLIKKGLSSSYNGTIYLSGCHTAAGYGDPKSFAAKVHSTFASKGYKLLSVAGTPGEAWTKDSGDKGAVPSAVSEDLAKNIEKWKKSVAKLEKALEQGQADLKDVETQVKKLEDEYVDMRKMILDFPPEAHDLMEKKLLEPLAKSRNELAPAQKDMMQSNKSLEGAIKSEQTYLTKMQDLMKDKKKLQSGEITQSDYDRKEAEVFTVEDWWGVFGPAKATSAKVKKDSSKVGGLFSQFKAKFSKPKEKV